MAEVDNALMPFETALAMVKDGETMIAREGWNGEGLIVMAQLPDEDSKMENPYLYIDARALGGGRNPWVPSATDLFAEDWYEVK